jgi:hypothetical protein
VGSRLALRWDRRFDQVRVVQGLRALGSPGGGVQRRRKQALRVVSDPPGALERLDASSVR